MTTDPSEGNQSENVLSALPEDSEHKTLQIHFAFCHFYSGP